jgi:glycosyltransferase involved in cell wall biosynthesis
MNECFARAEGEFCIVADDDDFYLPDRVSKQIQPMLDDPTIQVTGTSRLYYYLHGTQRAFRYQNISQKKWIGAIAVRKSAWETRKFADKPHGADFDLLQQIPFDQWCDLNDLGLLVAAIHSTNAASKSLSSPSLVEEPWATIEGILDA